MANKCDMPPKRYKAVVSSLIKLRSPVNRLRVTATPSWFKPECSLLASVNLIGVIIARVSIVRVNIFKVSDVDSLGVIRISALIH